MTKFRQILDEFRMVLEEKEQVREELIKLTREMRINSTKAVAFLHAGEIKKAEEHLNKALELMEKIYEFKKYPDIYYPITHDAMQELVEAYSFYHVLKHENLEIDFLKLKVEIPAILTGLADMVGEIRRYTLDILRKGEDFEKAEKMIKIMEEIYSNLLPFTNFPDKLIPNLRPKVDYIRGAIERTKSDFIAAKVASIEKLIKT